MRSTFHFLHPVWFLGSVILMAAFSCNNDSKSEYRSDTIAVVTDTMTNLRSDTAVELILNHAEAKISGTYPDTTVAGTVNFDVDSSGKLKMTLDISVPAKAGKSVAVHIHEHGDCGDTAKMAHEHWNPARTPHGKWGSTAFHTGDIGNVNLDAKGKGTLTITTDLWTLGGKPEKDILGRSIIVHSGVDDYTSQPSGNSGTRIGCGVIH